MVIHPDDRIQRGSQNGASAPLALEDRSFSALAADELPDLIPDRRHRPKQVRIWGGNSAGETLDHANDVVVETNRESKRAVNANRACDRRARKVGVVNHVFNPCGFPHGPHASGQADTRWKERFFSRSEKRCGTSSITRPRREAAQSLRAVVNEPECTDLPLEAFTNGSQDGGRGLGQRRRARENFADRVRGCSPTLARFAFRNGGCQKQARPRQHAHEHLEKNQALMHHGTGKRTCPMDGVPNCHRRGREDNERGRRLSQSHRRHDDQTENEYSKGC